MPSTIKSSQAPSSEQSSVLFPPPSKSPHAAAAESQSSSPGRSSSPVAPAFSPITPKVLPAFPATISQPPATEPPSAVDQSTGHAQQQQDVPVTTSAEYIPKPPPQPFSSDDSIDGVALKAAISSLQFQRQKAHEDIKALDELKKLALADPERFTEELVAGRLKEQRHDFGSIRELLDARAEEKDTQAAASAELEHDHTRTSVDGDSNMAEVPASQPSAYGELGSSQRSQIPNETPSFPPLPGPQNVVRMPHVNWDKYHIVGEPLDSLHDQQRRWPGTAPFQQNRGREFTVAAPYSPFLDTLETQGGHTRNNSDGSRKDSIAPSTAAGTPTVAEHPYETRRTSKNHTQ